VNGRSLAGPAVRVSAVGAGGTAETSAGEGVRAERQDHFGVYGARPSPYSPDHRHSPITGTPRITDPIEAHPVAGTAVYETGAAYGTGPDEDITGE
jgi:hypothetical protein